jgi:hypothetical protein
VVDVRERSAVAVPSLEPQQVLTELKSSPRGLSADEAAARREVVGANRLPTARRRPVLAELESQFANMFAVVLMVAAGITFLAYALTTPRSAADLELAIGILGVDRPRQRPGERGVVRAGLGGRRARLARDGARVDDQAGRMTGLRPPPRDQGLYRDGPMPLGQVPPPAQAGKISLILEET